MKKKPKSSGGGANWMDTYGDMVTLLLCFFVMLYSMSTIDQAKWNALVEAFNPDVTMEELANTSNPPSDQNEFTENQMEQQMQELFTAMNEYVEGAGLSNDITLTNGNGYVFISFDDAVFFAGDSYTLLPSGEAVLDQVALSIADTAEYVNEIRVLGHTAQALPDAANPVLADRMLSSNRATMITVYLQEKDIIDPARIISVGYGQWRPAASNETEDTRAQNRRVELIISGLDSSGDFEDEIETYYTMRGDESAPV